MNLYCTLVYVVIVLLGIQAIVVTGLLWTLGIFATADGDASVGGTAILTSSVIIIGHVLLMILAGTIAGFVKCIMQIEKNGR